MDPAGCQPGPGAEDRVSDAEPSQRVHRVRPQGEARADLPELRLTLPYDNVEPRIARLLLNFLKFLQRVLRRLVLIFAEEGLRNRIGKTESRYRLGVDGAITYRKLWWT